MSDRLRRWRRSARPLERRRPGLAGRAALVTVAVAFVAVLITGLVSAGLVRSASQDEARRTLGRYAELVASRPANGQPTARARTRTLFHRLDIDLVFVGVDATASAGRRTVPSQLLTAAAAGRTVDDIETIGGRRSLVEVRPLDTGGGVVLVQPVSAGTSEVARSLRGRLLVALLCGLAVAGLAGVLLARWLARPLQHAAAAAHRLAAGEREVRVEPEGPAEVAEVADSLNVLASALATSEGRQRDFLLSVSHELRTPLTAVMGYAEALADGVVPPQDVRSTGATVLAEAGRLDRLVADLLDLARLGAQDFRIDLLPADLTSLLLGTATVWRSRCEREGVVLRVELPEAPLVVSTDAARVRQVVDGLAENALRATPAGAPVVLALRQESAYAVIEVRDGGPGLTDDDLRVAFERSALHDRYRGVRRVGTGVGLALVAGLVTRLGGRAEAGHAPEGGARFTVSLPRTAGPTARRTVQR